MKQGCLMKIKKEVITGVRIRPDRAERLKEKALEITIEIKEHVNESDLVNFLIDTQLEKIKVTKDGTLYIGEKPK